MMPGVSRALHVASSPGGRLSRPAAARSAICAAVIPLFLLSMGAAAQLGPSPLPPPTTERFTEPDRQAGKLVCPGGFPTDLTATNCEFTPGARLQQWITTSFTDQALLGAVAFGTAAELIRSPSEWPRSWEGLGQRVGVRYTQGAARGSAEYLVGTLLRDDPRHLSYKNDPHTHYGLKVVSCSASGIETRWYGAAGHMALRRIGHPLLDSVTVLHSDPCGNGSRLPALDRLVGIWAGAYAGDPWYPRAENTPQNVGQRAAMAYGTTLLGSFYTEFSPEILREVSRVFSASRRPPD